jgi:hypothetical protein
MTKVTLIELNEFNQELLEKASHVFNLSHLKKLVSMTATHTSTQDSYESDFLEPWVQWVSVHTGLPSSQHGIKHLGDVPDLMTPQLWEALSKEGITSGVWGAMNASRSSADLCAFFMPDPWTASEKAFPQELNAFLDPLRLVSKNYLNPDKKIVLKLLKNLKNLFASHKLIKDLVKDIPRFLSQLIRFRGAHFVFIAFFEYVSIRLFLKYKKKYQVDFSCLFINTLAHIQHHHWHGHDFSQNKPLQLGLKYIDRSLGFIFQALEDHESLIVCNALSQKNSVEDEPWILYRPLKHKDFLGAAGLSPRRIEEHMTHDAHLYFSTKFECQEALSCLEKATVMGKPLFVVESYADDPLKLFYRLAFTDPLNLHGVILINQKRLDFFKFYKAIVERTGKHIQTGTIYSNTTLFPINIKNHEIYNYILEIFKIKSLDVLGNTLVESK